MDQLLTVANVIENLVLENEKAAVDGQASFRGVLNPLNGTLIIKFNIVNGLAWPDTEEVSNLVGLLEKFYQIDVTQNSDR
jgi:hypothetical protein